MPRQAIVVALSLLCGSSAVVYAADLALTAEPYLTGGVYTRPVLPQEGEKVTVIVRAQCAGQIDAAPQARLTLLSPAGTTVAEQSLALKRTEDQAEASWTWTAGANGLYKVRAQVDPANQIAETDEDNNAAELTLPVLVKGRKLHFAWYREVGTTRWTTCVTSANDAEQRARLAERGVIPLRRAYGGASWRSYDKKKAETHPDEVLKEIEEIFYKRYTAGPGECAGMGIDETGGYPGGFKLKRTVASMKALVRAKREMPDRFFAVWNGGGVTLPPIPYFRQGVDLLLLETYVFRAVPQGLGTEEIYEMIRDRLDPFIRSHDMIVPAYGNWCHTLIGLDTSERPDYIDLGEQEEVVRFIRRICPEMRGIAWYTGGYGGYGLERSPETDKHHQAVLTNADRLCFDYYVKPCVTLMAHSLWPNRRASGSWELVAAASNIGGIDSGPITVEFWVDGKKVGRQTVDRVPAGPNRLCNRVLLRQGIRIKPGLHAFEARIVSAGQATTLDAVAQCSRMIR